MSTSIIQERLISYQSKTIIEQENALKEIAQEIALMSLSRSGFFRVGAFQGGTCLRILYGLERFSEDLDFVLEKTDRNFSWELFIKDMSLDFETFGYHLEVTDRSKIHKNVKIAFLKVDSIGGLLTLKDSDSGKVKLTIKLEIDTNPPKNSQYEIKYLDFPLPFSIKTQNMPSLFSGKCHALLCREYIKGRDWFDFSWYVSRKTRLNFQLLESAINQQGPWSLQNIKVDKEWLIQTLESKIQNIDWMLAKKDVARFLKSKDLPILDLWSADFFLSSLEKLYEILKTE